jgi:hypothetical protein
LPLGKAAQQGQGPIKWTFTLERAHQIGPRLSNADSGGHAEQLAGQAIEFFRLPLEAANMRLPRITEQRNTV